MSPRRSVLRLAIVAAILGAVTVGVTYLATSQEPDRTEELRPPGGGEPYIPDDKQAMWLARYQAAVTDKAAEEKRIGDARATYEADRKDSPTTARDYLISFSAPVPVLPLLQRIESNAEIKLNELFTWQHAPGSVHPRTGLQTAESLGWPASRPDVVADLIARLLGEHLDRTDQNLAAHEQNAETDGARTGAKNQRGEITSMRAQLSNSGPLLYGISCRCTPRALDELAQESWFAIKVVEARNLFQAPIFIVDPLRDQVIQTNGRYGRE